MLLTCNSYREYIQESHTSHICAHSTHRYSDSQTDGQTLLPHPPSTYKHVKDRLVDFY